MLITLCECVCVCVAFVRITTGYTHRHGSNDEQPVSRIVTKKHNASSCKNDQKPCNGNWANHRCVLYCKVAQSDRSAQIQYRKQGFVQKLCFLIFSIRFFVSQSSIALLFANEPKAIWKGAPALAQGSHAMPKRLADHESLYFDPFRNCSSWESMLMHKHENIGWTAENISELKNI